MHVINPFMLNNYNVSTYVERKISKGENFGELSLMKEMEHIILTN